MLARVYIICSLSIYLVGGGLIIEANIPVQELEGQRGEGAYFRRGLIFGRIRYVKLDHTLYSITIVLYTIIHCIIYIVTCVSKN